MRHSSLAFSPRLSASRLLTAACLGLASAVAADFPKPILHFDASAKDSLVLQDGAVESWKDLDGQGELIPVNKAASFSIEEQDGSGLRLKGNNALVLKSEHPLESEKIALYVVARTNGKKAGQYFVSAPKNSPFDLFTGDRQFDSQIGPAQPARKRGLALDTKMHIFELVNVVSDNPKHALGPGFFSMDGYPCGYPFNQKQAALSPGLVFGGNDEGKAGYLDGEIAEILIFDRDLAPDDRRALLEQLSKKWGTASPTIPGDEGVPALTPAPVPWADAYTSWGIFNQPPESPDGRMLAYIVFDDPPTLDAPFKKFSIWVCPTDLSTPPRLLSRPDCVANNHNGAVLQWVTDDLLIYQGRTSKGRAEQVINVINARDGQIVHGPYTGAFLGEGTAGSKILLSVESDSSNVGAPGIYSLDFTSGKVEHVVLTEDLKPFTKDIAWEGFKSDTKSWKLTHPKYSPSGEKVCFALSPRGGTILFTCRSDGSDLHCWGEDKPLHQLWFDNDSICGADERTDDGQPDNLSFRRWDLNRNLIETIAGPVNHTALSEDRAWCAGETFYGGYPVILRLYRKGDTHPAALVDLGNPEVIWQNTGHANPAFSRDGQRLYFHRATSDGRKQACFVNISRLKGPTPK